MPEPPSSPKDIKLSPKKWYKRKLLIYPVIIALVIIGVMYYEIGIINKPSIGIVTNPTPAQQGAGLSLNFTPSPVTGTYISFAYPKLFAVDKATQKPQDPILASYVYQYNDTGSWLLAITVTDLQSDSLKADSSYYARLLNPTEYQLATVAVKNNTFQVMTDTQAAGFGKVAFSLHNNMSADISLTGYDDLGTANLQKAFNIVLGSFSWR
jgi:hypothetical protein